MSFNAIRFDDYLKYGDNISNCEDDIYFEDGILFIKFNSNSVINFSIKKNVKSLKELNEHTVNLKIDNLHENYINEYLTKKRHNFKGFNEQIKYYNNKTAKNSISKLFQNSKQIISVGSGRFKLKDGNGTKNKSTSKTDFIIDGKKVSVKAHRSSGTIAKGELISIFESYKFKKVQKDSAKQLLSMWDDKSKLSTDEKENLKRNANALLSNLLCDGKFIEHIIKCFYIGDFKFPEGSIAIPDYLLTLDYKDKEWKLLDLRKQETIDIIKDKLEIKFSTNKTYNIMLRMDIEVKK